MFSLLRLINTMTAHEKKAFKRDSRFWGEPSQGLIYVRLFDALNDYTNSDQVKPQHEGLISFLATRFKPKEMEQLGVRIPYLYERLLESMRFLHPTQQSLKYLNALIQDIHFLLQKELHEECLEKILEAKALAKALDRPAYILDLSFWERRLLRMLKQADERLYSSQHTKEKEAALQQLTDTLRMEELNDQVKLAIVGIQPLPEDAPAQIRHYFQLPKPESYPHHQFSRLRYYAITATENLSIYYKSKKMDWPAEWHNDLTTSINELLELPQRAFGFSNDEGAVAKELVVKNWKELILSGQYDALEQKLDQALKSGDDFFVFKEVFYFKAQSYIGRGDYEGAMEYLRNARAYSAFLRFQDRIPPSRLMVISFVGYYTAIMLKDYKEAALWVQNVLNSPHYQLWADIRIAAHYTHIISTAQLKDAQRGQQALKNLKALLKKPELKIAEPEKNFINALNAVLYKLLDPQKPPKAPDQLIARCEELKSYLKENRIPEPYKIPLVWILSTLKQTTMQEELSLM